MCPTPSATDCFQLTSNEVHNWCVSLDVSAEARARFYATLTEEEQDRSARYRSEHDQRRFVVARGALRDLLGRYLGTQPGAIRFVYNASGKPALDPQFGNRLRFNLSHSVECAVIAIVADTDIGVDVEFIRAQPDAAALARRCFAAADVDRWNRLPSYLQPQAFLRLWTRMEARTKALGVGLDNDAALDDPAAARRWSLYEFLPAPGYIGALAIEGDGWRVRQLDWR